MTIIASGRLGVSLCLPEKTQGKKCQVAQFIQLSWYDTRDPLVNCPLVPYLEVRTREFPFVLFGITGGCSLCAAGFPRWT
eukprot:1138369-Pelagomonas_calceolata.AAC.2